MTKGKYGDYGGRYVPETLINPLIELEKAYKKNIKDEGFLNEFNNLLKEYAGRPSNLYFAQRMTKDLGGPKIYLKREDLNHTGSHKINNVLGQTLLAKKMGKKKVVAETGAGQHGVATATAAALNDLECVVFMGSEDMERQKMNVYRMELLGARVIEASSGTGTLKDATNEAFKYWAKTCEDTFYVLGSVVGPHPYPEMVRNFQSVIGKETKRQILEKEGKLPDTIVACVGGGSNSMGIFHEFIDEKNIKLVGCEAAGLGIHTNKHAATIQKGSKGVFHGMKSLFLQNDEGQITPVYSISAGLDYPGVGPEHSYLNEISRVEYVSITDKEAVDAMIYLSRKEGIIPAIESSHAVSYVIKNAKMMNKNSIVVINLSGRGDKDVKAIHDYLKMEDYYEQQNR